MIKITNVDTYGWEAAIRGMRNPLNSWDKSDSIYVGDDYYANTMVGENDFALMKKLGNAGPDHGKFLRMITVTMDVTAPLYWWKEADTYKVGTVANSCSTMHKIQAKEFMWDDFSTEHLINKYLYEEIIDELNRYRVLYLGYDNLSDDFKQNHSKKEIWWQMIQLLPSSYNQKRTVQLNYQVLKNMYHARKNHKLDEWRDFCEWIKTLPYSELITGSDIN